MTKAKYQNNNKIRTILNTYSPYRISIFGFTTILLVLCCSGFINAQNYQTINLERESYFETSYYNMELYGENINFCQYEDCIISIRVDTVINNDPSFVFPKYARGDESMDVGICPLDSWLGPKVDFLPDGKELYFNGNGDTIVLETQAAVGETWNLFTLSSDSYFEASVLAVQNEMVLGTLENVKKIRLQLKDSNGDDLSHPLNGFEIQIGETSGWIRTCDMYHFPNDISAKTLVGRNNPKVGIQLLTGKDIFNFSIGDERHYYSEVIGTFTISSSKEWVSEVIISKDSTDESYTYGVDITRYYIYSEPMYGGSDTSYSAYNYTYSVNTNDPILNTPPFELAYGPFGPIGFNNYHYDLTGEQLRLETYTAFGPAYNDPNCLEFIYDVSGSTQYMDCLGIVAVNNFNFSSYNSNLVYYKKGNTTWGTPINFETLLPIRELNNQPNHYDIFPSPTNNVLNIHTLKNGSTIAHWQLYNVDGLLQKEGHGQSQNQIQIKVDDLSVGLYYLKIVNEAGERFHYPVVVSD